MSSEADVAILRRLFFRRFFDNELVAPNGGGEQKMALVYAALIVPGLFASVPLLFKYMSPFLTPGQRLILGLDDTVLCVSISMLVMAIATVVSWDTLTLDVRDVAMLGPLPLTRGTLVAAKLQSLGLFVLSFGIAVNAMPSLLFPPILFGTLDIGFLRGAWVVAIHGVVSLAAGCFGFLCVLAVRQTLAVTCSPRVFRRASAVVQPALLLLLVTAFLLLPAFPSTSRAARAWNGTLPPLGPPGWFLGLHEVLSGRLVLDAPDIVKPTGRSRFTPARADTDRQRYLAHMPEFARNARLAALAFLLVGSLAAGGYAIESRRLVRRVPPVRLARGWVTRQAAALAEAAIVRDPLSRATFFFTLQTLVRGSTQRLYVSGGLAISCAAVILFVPKRELTALLQGISEPAVWSVGVQTFLVAALAGTLRLVATVPAELGANWAFRVTWLSEPGPYMAGVRRAALLVATLPVLALVPLHMVAWGLAVTLVHALFGLLCVALMVEWLFRDLRALPFTCGVNPVNSRALFLRTAGTVVIAAVLLARVEHWGYGTPTRAGVALGLVGAGFVGAALWRQHRQRAWTDVVFDEPPEPETQRLGISSGTD